MNLTFSNLARASRRRNPPFRQRRDHSGQTLVEFALVLPMVLLLLLGVVDLGRAVTAYAALAHSAREGARVGIYSTTSDSDIRATIRAQGTMLSGLSDSDISISPSSLRHAGDHLTVSIDYEFEAVTPLIAACWGGGPLHLNGASTVKVE